MNKYEDEDKADRNAKYGFASWLYRNARIIVISVFAFAVIYDSFFTVQETQRGGMRRFGHQVSEQPIMPGLHFKLPFVETADLMQVSVDNLRIDNLHVYTVDNQLVTISIGITYRWPDSSVLNALYKVGTPGNSSFMHNVEQIASDRAKKIFARHNTTKISEDRAEISHDVQQVLGDDIRSIFGMDIIDLQIPALEYSSVFVASVEAAVKAKNDAIAAENTVNRIRYEGQQKVVTAKAEAEATIATAMATKQRAILEAEGEAQSIKIRGDALKDNPRVIELTIAQRWQGAPPQTILGGSAAVPFFNIGSTVATTH